MAHARRGSEISGADAIFSFSLVLSVFHLTISLILSALRYCPQVVAKGALEAVCKMCNRMVIQVPGIRGRITSIAGID
jgi:hypothetical protein